SAPLTEIPAYAPAGSLLVLYPDGIDTVLPSPSLSTATHTGDAREVWLFSGTAANPAHAQWHDDTGPVGTAQWTWTGRPAGALPASATFNGAPVTVTVANGVARVTVNGDGTLAFDGGGTLTITRGLSATTTVALH
ncbi:MAG TPA: hypothetical protein VLB44_06615, partial [Kofleriaceae bacterium]|nr:hypothetical protein [Kofleriaceae bacterium]